MARLPRGRHHHVPHRRLHQLAPARETGPVAEELDTELDGSRPGPDQTPEREGQTPHRRPGLLLDPLCQDHAP